MNYDEKGFSDPGDGLEVKHWFFLMKYLVGRGLNIFLKEKNKNFDKWIF